MLNIASSRNGSESGLEYVEESKISVENNFIFTFTDFFLHLSRITFEGVFIQKKLGVRRAPRDQQYRQIHVNSNETL